MEAGEIPVRSRHCKGIYYLSQIHILRIALREMELYDSRGISSAFFYFLKMRGVFMKKIKNSKSYFFVVLLLVMIVSACSSNQKSTEEQTSIAVSEQTSNTASEQTSSISSEADNDAYYPVTIQNYKYSKDPVDITFEKMPERVYVVNPSSLENMLALGLEDKIAKVSVGDETTEQAAEFIKKMGSTELTKEEVLGNNIDFILAWYSTFSDKYLGEVDYWHEKGINTYMALNSSVKKPAPNTLEDEYEDIRNLGKIFNVEDRAEALIAKMDKGIADAQEKVKEKGKIKTIILEVEKDNQLRLYGPETIGGVIAEKVGADLMTNEPRITAEQLIELNPDVIFTVYFGSSDELNEKTAVDLLKNNPALQSISAIQNDRIYPTPLAYTYVPGVIGL